MVFLLKRGGRLGDSQSSSRLMLQQENRARNQLNGYRPGLEHQVSLNLYDAAHLNEVDEVSRGDGRSEINLLRRTVALTVPDQRGIDMPHQTRYGLFVPIVRSDQFARLNANAASGMEFLAHAFGDAFALLPIHGRPELDYSYHRRRVPGEGLSRIRCALGSPADPFQLNVLLSKLEQRPCVTDQCGNVPHAHSPAGLRRKAE